MLDLINTLERINKLPLTTDERAELMRAVINDSRREGATIKRRPGPKTGGKPSVASQVRHALREINDWVRPRDIGELLDMKSGSVSIALKDMVASGEVQRKEDENGERLPNGRLVSWYRIVDPN